MSKENKLGQEPAFSNTETYNPNNMECNSTFQVGMSKRYWTAAKIMSGLIADPNVILGAKELPRTVKLAYNIADELLKQEHE